DPQLDAYGWQRTEASGAVGSTGRAVNVANTSTVQARIASMPSNAPGSATLSAAVHQAPAHFSYSTCFFLSRLSATAPATVAATIRPTNTYVVAWGAAQRRSAMPTMSAAIAASSVAVHAALIAATAVSAWSTEPRRSAPGRRRSYRISRTSGVPPWKP